MVPYIPEVLVRERHQRYVEEAARHRLVSQRRGRGRADARQRLAGRVLADRAMARRVDWAGCTAADAAGGR